MRSALGQAQRQRRRARAGADHRIGDPEPGPLVDQGGAEGGLYAHPTCHSMSKCAARGRRWWCCTDSHRPVGSGAASETSWPNRTRSSPWTFPVTAAPGRCGPICRRRRGSWPRRCGRPSATSRAPARLLAGRPGGPARRHGTDLALSHAVLIGVTAGIEDPTERERRRQSDEALADELETSGDVEQLPRRLAAGPDVRPARPPTQPSAPSASATARPGSRRACGCAGRAPRSRCGIASRRSAVPSWPWRERTTPASRRTPSGSPVSAPRPSHRSCRAAVMPCIWPSPSRPGGSSVTGSIRSSRAQLTRPRTSSHMSSPTVRRAPVTIWRRAVAPSMGSSARPFWSPRASRTG